MATASFALQNGRSFEAVGSRYVCRRCRSLVPGRSSLSPGQTVSQRRTKQSRQTRSYQSSAPSSAREATELSSESRTLHRSPRFLALRFQKEPEEGRYNIRKVLSSWNREHARNQAESIQAKTERAKEKPRSALTQLAMKTKMQRDMLEESEDPENDKYAVFRDLEDSDVQTQFFDESVASFEQEPLRMGDLVDYLGGGLVGVYVKPGHSGSRKVMAQLLTDRGEYIEVPENRIGFRLSRFVDPDDLQPLLPFLPTDGQVTLSSAGLEDLMYNVPRQLAAPIIAKIKVFEDASIEVYRQHARALDDCVKALGDRQKPFSVTLPRATQILFGLQSQQDATPEELWAVHKALTKVEYGTVKSLNYRSDRMWHVLSVHEVHIIERVIEWWHEYQHWRMNEQDPSTASAPKAINLDKLVKLNATRSRTDPRIFQQFMYMARSLVLKNRQSRQYMDTPTDALRVATDSADVSPATLKHNEDFVAYGKSFDPSHSVILRFLLLVVQREVKFNSMATSIAVLIARETGLYEGIKDHEYSLVLFLQEMGVLSPWEGGLVSLGSRFVRGYDVSHDTDHAWSRAVKSIDSGLSTFKDRMSELRKDWSDHDVYCVDSASTTTVDDGFSIESVSGNRSQVWFHVHVANPTAFIGPGHPISKYARLVGSSLYLPHAHQGMIDDRFIAELTSLDKNRPCLTFSTKLDEDGNILEYNITPGRVRKVHFFTPDTLRKAVFSTDISTERKDHTGVAPDKAGRPLLELRDLSEKHINDLKLWRRFAEARFKKRSTALNELMTQAWQQDKYDLSISNAPIILPDYTTIRHFTEQPLVRLIETTKAVQAQASADIDLVQEAMLLAGTAAASWCAKRGIPVPYRIATTPDGKPSREDYFEEYIEPLMRQNLPVSRAKLMEMASLIKSQNSIAPREHEAIGVDAYLRVTSPLRRFADMLAHFQIEAALLNDAATSADDSAIVPRNVLAYSAQQMAEELTHHANVQLKAFLIGDRARTQWILRYLSMALYHGHGKLPEVVTVRLKAKHRSQMNTSKNAYSIEGFRISCEIEDLAGLSEDEMTVGDTFRARITGVCMETQMARVSILSLQDRQSEFIYPSQYQAVAETVL